MNDKGTTDEYTQQIKVISRTNFGRKKTSSIKVGTKNM